MPRLFFLLFVCLPVILAGCIHPSLFSRKEDPEPEIAESRPFVPTCLAFSSDGAILAVGYASGNEGRVRLLDPASLKMKREFPVKCGLWDLMFEPNGQKLLIQGSVTYYQKQTNPSRSLFDWFDTDQKPNALPPLVSTKSGFIDTITGKYQSVPNSITKEEVISADRDSNLTIGEEQPGTVEIRPVFSSSPNPKTMKIHFGTIKRVAIATSHGPLAFTDHKDNVYLHNLTPDAKGVILPIDEEIKAVGEMAFSADGKHLVAACEACYPKPNRLIVWSVPTRELNQKLPLQSVDDKLTLSGDGCYLIAHKHEAVIWDLISGEQLFRQTPHPVRCFRSR